MDEHWRWGIIKQRLTFTASLSIDQKHILPFDHCPTLNVCSEGTIRKDRLVQACYKAQVPNGRLLCYAIGQRSYYQRECIHESTYKVAM